MPTSRTAIEDTSCRPLSNLALLTVGGRDLRSQFFDIVVTAESSAYYILHLFVVTIYSYFRLPCWTTGKMAKSIRSKVKRKHRSEFRRTIGEEAAQANMKKIQAKLKECISNGSKSSIAALSSLLDTAECESMEGREGTGMDVTKDNSVDGFNLETASMDEAVMDTVECNSRKRIEKIPIKVSDNKKKKKYWVDNVPGQTGSHLARKRISRAKKRGQITNGSHVRKSRTSKTKKDLCVF